MAHESRKTKLEPIWMLGRDIIGEVERYVKRPNLDAAFLLTEGQLDSLLASAEMPVVRNGQIVEWADFGAELAQMVSEDADAKAYFDLTSARGKRTAIADAVQDYDDWLASFFDRVKSRSEPDAPLLPHPATESVLRGREFGDVAAEFGAHLSFDKSEKELRAFLRLYEDEKLNRRNFTRADFKTGLVAAGLWAAIESCNTPQRIRWGKNGPLFAKKEKVPPWEYFGGEGEMFWWWLGKETRRQARCQLLEGTTRSTTRELDDDSEFSENFGPGYHVAHTPPTSLSFLKLFEIDYDRKNGKAARDILATQNKRAVELAEKQARKEAERTIQRLKDAGHLASLELSMIEPSPEKILTALVHVLGVEAYEAKQHPSERDEVARENAQRRLDLILIEAKPVERRIIEEILDRGGKARWREVAQAVGISETSAKVVINRFKKRLRARGHLG